jgi:hypothetical protein
MYQYGYLMFPIYYLKFTSESREETYEKLAKLIEWAIVFYMQSLEKDVPNSIARQVCYDYYRNTDSLDYRVKTKLDALAEEDEISWPEEADCFQHNEFVADEEIEVIEDAMLNDEVFGNLCLVHYLKHMIKYQLRIQYDSEALYALYCQYNANKKPEKSVPLVSLNTHWVFDTKEGKIPLELFRLICAARSIIGKKRYAITHRAMIVSRMFGLRSPRDVHTLDEKQREYYEYYNKRYPFNKLFDKAIHRGFLTKISAYRGYYISKDLQVDQLEAEIMKSLNRKQKKKKQAKASEKKIKQSIKAHKEAINKLQQGTNGTP